MGTSPITRCSVVKSAFEIFGASPCILWVQEAESAPAQAMTQVIVAAAVGVVPAGYVGLPSNVQCLCNRPVRHRMPLPCFEGTPLPEVTQSQWLVRCGAHRIRLASSDRVTVTRPTLRVSPCEQALRTAWIHCFSCHDPGRGGKTNIEFRQGELMVLYH